MKPYLQDGPSVLQDLETTMDGLSSKEAVKRSEKYGKNKLAEGKKETVFQRFLKYLL